jgi:hypothetical protein
MRNMCLLCTMLLTVSLAFAQAPPSKPFSPFEQELINNQKQFIQAWQEKNAAYVRQTVSDDFKGIAQNGDFYDKSELVGATLEGLPKDFRIYDIDVVRLDDSCAVVAYNTIVPGSRPRYRRMSDAWVKDGGKWKLKFQQLTPNLWSATDLD